MFIMTGKYTFYLFHQTFLKWDYYRPRCSIRVEQDKLEGHRLTTWDHSHKKCQQVLVPCFSWSWKISWIDTKKKKTGNTLWSLFWTIWKRYKIQSVLLQFFCVRWIDNLIHIMILIQMDVCHRDEKGQYAYLGI